MIQKQIKWVFIIYSTLYFIPLLMVAETIKEAHFAKINSTIFVSGTVIAQLSNNEIILSDNSESIIIYLDRTNKNLFNKNAQLSDLYNRKIRVQGIVQSIKQKHTSIKAIKATRIEVEN